MWKLQIFEDGYKITSANEIVLEIVKGNEILIADVNNI